MYSGFRSQSLREWSAQVLSGLNPLYTVWSACNNYRSETTRKPNHIPAGWWQTWSSKQCTPSRMLLLQIEWLQRCLVASALAKGSLTLTPALPAKKKLFLWAQALPLNHLEIVAAKGCVSTWFWKQKWVKWKRAIHHRIQNRVPGGLWITSCYGNPAVYPSNTVYCLLSGIQCHMKSKNADAPTFLNKEDNQFKDLHNPLDVIFRGLWEKNIGTSTSHHLPFDKDEIDHLWATGILGTGNPTSLLNAVFL